MAAAAPTVRPFTSLLVLREDGAEQLGVGLGAHDLVILVDVALRRGEVLEREHHLCMHTAQLHVAGPGPLCLGWGTRHRRTIWCASDAACDIIFLLTGLLTYLLTHVLTHLEDPAVHLDVHVHAGRRLEVPVEAAAAAQLLVARLDLVR
eukprot:scaffold24420_cov66-Phaeocystis_antarctica.AAC.3